MLGLPNPRVFDLNGTAFEYVSAGTGGPSIVLINGSGGPLEGWHRIFPLLSGHVTVFAYNRPGLGKSSKPSRPQTAGAMVDDLKGLLDGVSVPKPWVLVGHSFGGLVANLFARTQAPSVSAVVLLEATAPQDVTLLRQYESTLQKAVAWVANRVLPLHPNHEALHADQSAAEVVAAPGFPAIPLLVVTGTRPAMAWASRQDHLALRRMHQRELATLSPHGQQLEASRSGHFPQLSEPELVASAILRLLAAAR